MEEERPRTGQILEMHLGTSVLRTEYCTYQKLAPGTSTQYSVDVLPCEEFDLIT
jgi:hypothetical protein